MTRYMLDTNTVSHLVRKNPHVAKRITEESVSSLCISAITAGELAFGLAKRPEALKLRAAVGEFLRRVDTVPWDINVAGYYGTIRIESQGSGKTIAPLEMLIAAHAFALGATLVTNDHAFTMIPNLKVEDWTQAA